jgi:hypothetical protein
VAKENEALDEAPKTIRIDQRRTLRSAFDPRRTHPLLDVYDQRSTEIKKRLPEAQTKGECLQVNASLEDEYHDLTSC